MTITAEDTQIVKSVVVVHTVDVIHLKRYERALPLTKTTLPTLVSVFPDQCLLKCVLMSGRTWFRIILFIPTLTSMMCGRKL